jgi:predicted RecA/RadA family phage recombinase
MSNVNRIRWGCGAPIPAPVESATVIEIGDFICVASDYAVPASGIADAGDAAANMEAVADAFAGIAISASADGDTDDVLIVQEGIFMLNQKAAAAIGFGDPVAIYADATAAEDQTVVEDATSPIATCIKTHDNTTTETLCKLLPSKIFGTPQG